MAQVHGPELLAPGFSLAPAWPGLVSCSHLGSRSADEKYLAASLPLSVNSFKGKKKLTEKINFKQWTGSL